MVITPLTKEIGTPLFTTARLAEIRRNCYAIGRIGCFPSNTRHTLRGVQSGRIRDLMRTFPSIANTLLLSVSLSLSLFAPLARATPSSSLSESTCELKASLEEFRAHALANSTLVAEIDRYYATQLAKAI